MKKLILTIVLFLFSLTKLTAQWEILNEGIGQVRSIDFINENIGWLGGWEGALLKTTDGGENWITIPMNTSWNTIQIDFINESVGWAVGDALWKSSDGGFTWTQQLNIGFNSLYIIDINNVYAVGGNKIYKTSNGGTDWIDVSPNLPDRNYKSVWFQDSLMGVAVGNYFDLSAFRDVGIILRTNDGGNNWDETIVNEFNSIYDLQFLDNTTGYFRANLDTINFICKTEDMGSSWSVKTQQPYSITTYQYLDNNNAYAVMNDSIPSNNVMKSIDGGVSWQLFQKLNMNFVSPIKIYFYNSSDGFLLCSFPGDAANFTPSSLLRYTVGHQWEFNILSYPLNDVYFNNENITYILGGYCVGVHPHPNGIIFSSTNAGKTWYADYGTNNPFRSTFFVNQSLGFSIASMQCRGIGSEIYKTTDGGNDWEMVYEDSYDSTEFAFDGNEICFMNEEIGWAVGYGLDYELREAVILGTIDSGEHWSIEWIDSTIGARAPGLRSICFSDTIGWTVGESGLIVKYTPQIGWVKQTSVTDLPLNKVFFLDDNHGWIIGGYQNDNDFQKIFLRTTNGGTNWTTVPNIPFLFRDIAFVDNNFGWAIGYDSSGVGGILKSTDGGNSWEVEKGNLSSKLNSLFIKDNYGWAVGENGLILRTTNAGPTWIDEENKTLPTEFALEQNYPNPFNPTTKIKYSMPSNVKGETSKVILKIYDVLGREVAALVNEAKQPGVYEIEFNASKLPSGVYFYQLRAGSFIQTRKMLLLR